MIIAMLMRRKRGTDLLHLPQQSRKHRAEVCVGTAHDD